MTPPSSLRSIGRFRDRGEDRSVRIWLKAPHPALDGDSPIDLMRGGEIDVVQKLVDHMLSGAPA